MKYLKQIAYIVLLIGGINWGVYGVSGYDVVDVLLGNIPVIANIVYALVGLSAFYIILNRFTLCECKTCSSVDSTCSCTHKECATCSVEEKK
jgi:uncharacterized membrane protein YuzA (DUF378 family)